MQNEFPLLFSFKSPSGAGSYPSSTYSLCSHETRGLSQFMPNEGAHPHTGTVGELTKIEEVRVETLCVGREVMVGAVEALKRYCYSL